MKATVSAILQKMKSWREEMKTCVVEVEATDLETNPEEKEPVAGQQVVPKEETAVKTVRALKSGTETTCRRRAPPTTEKLDPGQWWVAEEICRRLQKDDPPCHCCTAKGRMMSATRPYQGSRKNGRSGRDVGRNWSASLD
jgi:hypothetical protein